VVYKLVTALKILYTVAFVLLVMFSMNSLTLSLLYLINRKKVWGVKTPEMKAEWPSVTVQLPIFNERYMVDRLLKAMTSLDYPTDKLQIQVLDDSTDATKDVVAKLVKKLKSDGKNIEFLHRDDRSGFKAGALQAGLSSATGEFVAVFDADFLPEKDWLKRVVPFFQDDKIAFVQTRWGHINNRYNLITHLQGLALDAHFVIEQTARAGSGLLMSFNGTAGMWRVKAIQEAGGWQGDTLTEDIDLSFRTEIAGWKYIYAPDIVVMSELPAQMDAFKKQQVRWVKGNMQVTRKLLRNLLTAKIPFTTKFMGVMHLFMLFTPYTATLTVLALTFPISLVAPDFMKLFGWGSLGLVGPVVLYSLAETEFNPSLLKRIATLPLMSLLGMGLSLNCTWAVIRGFSSKSGVFERTPKYDIKNASETWLKNNYALPITPITAVELLMSVYLTTSSLYLYHEHNFGLPVWQFLAATAFLMVSGASLIQSAERARLMAHHKRLESSQI
jgi:cellulose synthase/poly-beta-1,6-N-acetylglucosamine synthase-like glycosyltransferase